MSKAISAATAVLWVLLSACAPSPIPLEVEKFVERRKTCEHFLGEVPDPGPENQARLDEVVKMTAMFCTGTDAELAALRTRYTANGAVTEKLRGYETEIEAKQ